MKYSYNEILEPWYPEEFKIIEMPPIKQNMYAVSNYGRVININTNRELSKLKTAGYDSVALQNNDNSRSVYFIHILIGYHFIPRTLDDIDNDRNIINHKNLIKSCNYVHNLEWVNRAENNAHAREFGHLKLNDSVVKRYKEGSWGNSNSQGSKNGMSRLTEDQVHTICKMLEAGYSYTDICNAIGLEGNDNDRHLIINIATGKRWNQISKNYNIPKPKHPTDFSQYIIPVCELLEKGLTNKEIINTLNMDNTGNKSSSFINRLRNKKIYTNITKNYKF